MTDQERGPLARRRAGRPRSRYALLLGLALIAGPAGAEAPAQAVDGDTLRLRGEVIRLADIDAPERPGRDGEVAARVMRGLLDRLGPVSCTGLGTSYYGRTIALCRLADGRDLGGLIVWLGHASARGGRYAGQERLAREAGRGMWAAGGGR